MTRTLLILISLLKFAELWIVNTSYGLLKGMPIRSADGQACHIFKGIPIAKPPLGERRFKLPEPPEPWEGVRDATRYSDACLSNSTVSRTKQKSMSEDCLYMNVFACESCLEKDHSCPVVFYVHGGSLNYDSAVMFDDQYITDRYSSKDVVFVISAFRLGIFGVLEVADEAVVPRNLPLYDIIAGLEMVHSEVEAFGGDPKRVTLMGHSQGASIVVVFTVSSLIDPDHRLFQQVLALSPAINFRIRSKLIGLTWELAHEAGCTASRFHPERPAPSEDAKMVACLRKVDALELLAKQRLLEERGKLLDGIVYGPPFVIEDLPIQDFVMECSARPMICSSTRFEFDMWKTEKTDDVGSFLRVSHPEQVRKKYFYDMSFKEHRHKYLTQASFTNNVMYSTAFTKKGVSVYLMEFDHGPVQIHASDMPYFIGLHMRNFTADDELVDRFYAKSFLNFIHGRKPDKDWLLFDPSKRNYYSIEANLSKGIFPSNKMDYHSEIVDYWLHNMTAFDRSLSKKAAIQRLSEQVDVTSGLSIFHTALSALLFGLSLALVFFILMAVWATLSPQDPPNHEQVPLVHRKETQINRKQTVIVSSLKRR